MNVHRKDWCWSWNANTLAIWCKELTHWNRPWCWERLKAGGEGDDRGWDGWMASLTHWTRVWVNSRSWWWTERPGVLQSMWSQRVGHDWVNWTEITLREIVAWNVSQELNPKEMHSFFLCCQNKTHNISNIMLWSFTYVPTAHFQDKSKESFQYCDYNNFC